MGSGVSHVLVDEGGGRLGSMLASVWSTSKVMFTHRAVGGEGSGHDGGPDGLIGSGVLSKSSGNESRNGREDLKELHFRDGRSSDA